MTPVVTLYSRPGCHLCDEARATLLRVRAELPFTLRELDIDRDDALQRAYFERIPVIELDGRELCRFFVDEPALRAALAGTGARAADPSTRPAITSAAT